MCKYKLLLSRVLDIFFAAFLLNVEKFNLDGMEMNMRAYCFYVTYLIKKILKKIEN
jgi:hypothetical protein